MILLPKIKSVKFRRKIRNMNQYVAQKNKFHKLYNL